MNKERKILEIERYQLVEVKITNLVSSKFTLPDVQNLRGKKIVGIEAFSTNAISTAPSERGVINNSVIGASYLTLVDCQSRQGVSQILLRSLEAARNAGRIRSFDNLILDISKCFIEIPNPAFLTADTSWLLGFYYTDL